MKIQWKKNLFVAWIGCFFTGASFSLVMPFIPVYVEQLGTPSDQVELFSGLAISVTAFASAIVAPIWGNLADRKGRKLMMIRACRRDDGNDGIVGLCSQCVLVTGHAFFKWHFIRLYS